MNGAEATLKALADSGVEVCFANPGTSEMQMVAALDREPRIRSVLCLFEGVVSGAADGYGRIAGKPAATLLHLGPGLGNALAGLHNARRAHTPIVNLVGEHATFHRAFDSPLTSDIESVAGSVSQWVRTAVSADDAIRSAQEAVAASLEAPGGSATLILPADTMWTRVQAAEAKSPPARWASGVDDRVAQAIAARVRSASAPALLLGGNAVDEACLDMAARLAGAGLRVMVDTFVARLPRGEGRFEPERIPYFGEAAEAALTDVDLLVTVHSRSPVAFFGYPGKASTFLPVGCEVVSLTRPGNPAHLMLESLVLALGATGSTAVAAYAAPPVDSRFNAHSIGAVIARHMPAGSIVSEDAATSGAPILKQTAGARAHDWLFLTGGAIGQALPVALGAALAAPDRKVIALTGDGAAAYTCQALWSIAREDLDVLSIVFVNHEYRILNIELERTGSGSPGPSARRLLELDGPRIDWSGLSTSLGVPATRCADIAAFEAAFLRAMEERGPGLLELVLKAA
jgi:acetolactate synthase-1/2/3 large subunit